MFDQSFARNWKEVNAQCIKVPDFHTCKWTFDKDPVSLHTAFTILLAKHSMEKIPYTKFTHLFRL